jgi:hypothetical protein
MMQVLALQLISMMCLNVATLLTDYTSSSLSYLLYITGPVIENTCLINPSKQKHPHVLPT